MQQRIKWATIGSALSIACLAPAAPASAQQTVQEFYSGPGKQMRMIIRTTAGGG